MGSEDYITELERLKRAPRIDCSMHADMDRFVKELRAFGGGIFDALFYRNIVHLVEKYARTCGDPDDQNFILSESLFVRAVYVALVIMKNETAELPTYFGKLRDLIVDRAHLRLLDTVANASIHGSADELLQLTRTVILEFVGKKVAPLPFPRADSKEELDNGLQCINFEAVCGWLEDDIMARLRKTPTGRIEVTRDSLIVAVREIIMRGINPGKSTTGNIRGAVEQVLYSLMGLPDYEALAGGASWTIVVIEELHMKHFAEVLGSYDKYCKQLKPEMEE
jgi:hypothetical protein